MERIEITEEMLEAGAEELNYRLWGARCEASISEDELFSALRKTLPNLELVRACQ